jgi:hypothetical protein
VRRATTPGPDRLATDPGAKGRSLFCCERRPLSPDGHGTRSPPIPGRENRGQGDDCCSMRIECAPPVNAGGIEGSQEVRWYAAGTSRAGGENHRESSLFASRRQSTRKEGSFARPESESRPSRPLEEGGPRGRRRGVAGTRFGDVANDRGIGRRPAWSGPSRLRPAVS